MIPAVGLTAPRALAEEMERTLQARDLAAVAPLDPCENPLEFVLRYGLKMDGRPFNSDLYPHLVQPYSSIAPMQVRMAGAQTGKTMEEFVRAIWFAVLRWGQRVGFYYPTLGTALDMAKNKFLPMLRSSVQLRAYIGVELPDGVAESSVSTTSLGPSKFTFMSLEGKDSTEGKTLAGAVFDELRRMKIDNVLRAMERQSSFSTLTTGFEPMLLRVSTARFPRQDIHAAFLEGTQQFFHTFCRCPEGVVLARAFPDCIVDLSGSSPEVRRRAEHACTMAGLPWCGVSDEERARYGEGMLCCPRCGTFILHPRLGWWEPENPSAYVDSYQYPQMLSPSFSGPRLAQKFYRPQQRADDTSGPIDVQEMYNSMAGMPWLSREAVPVNDETVSACVRPDLLWAANQSSHWRRRWIKQTTMGLDHMDGYICVAIKCRAPNGKFRTVHLEVLHAKNSDKGDPWDRAAYLMVEYDVTACLLEAGPNLNESRRFAARFPGRTFIVTYANSHSARLIRWPEKPGDQKGEELVQKGNVIINRGLALHWSLDTWVRREQEIPAPRALLQVLPMRRGRVMFTPRLEEGEWEPAALCEHGLFYHLTHSAFEKAYRNDAARELGEFYYEFSGIEGVDPHFTFCSMFADVALDRFGRHPPNGDYTAPWEREG